MATMHEHRQNTASILGALGELPANATPAQIDAAVDDALTDQRVEEASIRLLSILGADGYHHPAAA
jgi:hypothetical protein